MKRLFLILLILISFFLVPSTIFAHNANIPQDYGELSVEFTGTGYDAYVDFSHQDSEPWAGWVTVTATNSGLEAWGDFHFEIYDPIGGQDISNVEWRVDSPYEPASSQSITSWDLDNISIGATLDLYFYGDPVNPGQTATFSVYNENPNHLSFFGVKIYPTPLPVPGALLLFTSGLIGIMGLRKRLLDK